MVQSYEKGNIFRYDGAFQKLVMKQIKGEASQDLIWHITAHMKVAKPNWSNDHSVSMKPQHNYTWFEKKKVLSNEGSGKWLLRGKVKRVSSFLSILGLTQNHNNRGHLEHYP